MYTNFSKLFILLLISVVLVLVFKGKQSSVEAQSCFANCTSGQYFQNETNTCIDCPTGYYCPSDTTAPVPCSAGTYNPLTKQSSPAACMQCPDGEYQTAAAQHQCVGCPRGALCPNKAAAPDYSACSGGRYTPSTHSTECTDCPAGYKCADPSANPVVCPLGTYRAEAGANTDCLACSTGYYTPDTASKNCTICPAGSECDGTTKTQCSAGSYSYPAGQPCVQCPAGYSCVLDQAPQQCSNGTYSALGDSSCHTCAAGFYQTEPGQASCLPCGGGSECLDPAQFPTKCAAGKYSPYFHQSCDDCPTGSYSSEGATSCNDCPAGFKCPDPTQSPQECPYGYWSDRNSTQCDICPTGTYSNADHTYCLQCPVGYQCADPLVGPVQCSSGTYADQTGRTQCTVCPAGSACPDPAQSPVTCTNGWSGAGSTNCTICPYNYDCSSNNPTECGAGTYSPEGSQTCSNCPAGVTCRPTYRSCGTGYYSKESEDYCTACPAGSSCSSTTDPTACTVGTYSLEGEMSCTACPAGFYCNNTAMSPQPCPDGYYSTGGTAACTQCAEGYYCDEKTVAKQIPCEAGKYSIAGQSSCSVCPAGMACPSSFGYNPVACGSGTYSTGGQSECTSCPAGSYCPTQNELPLLCQPGFYSTEGASNCTRCPAGSSCADPTQTPQECGVGTYSESGWTVCLSCQGGILCSLGSTSPLDGTACPAGYYCPPGSSQPTPCPPGTKGNITGQTEKDSACFVCPAGKVCPEASTVVDDAAFDCHAGYYCPSGTRLTDEYPCPAGTYNPNTGATSINDCIPCNSGYYCELATAALVNTRVCDYGHYCPNGTTHENEYPCPAGTYNQYQGGKSAADCVACPIGAYCGPGTTNPVNCPRGTYNPDVNATNAENCFPCPAGWACSQTAMTTYDVFTCSEGHYCPEGTADPKAHPCPAGTYTNSTSLTRADDCQLCLQGYACEPGTGGTVKYPHLCKQGYYCPGVASLDPPTYYGSISAAGSGDYFTIPGLATGESQFPCPGGTYGTFDGAIHKDNCTQCPAGSYCSKGSPAISGACQAGYVCPAGSTYADAVPCPAGTYSSSTSLGDTSECTPCPVGQYCREASTAPIKCSPGSYANQTNTIEHGPADVGASPLSCTYCTAGYYCAMSGMDNVTECGAGFYSDKGWTACKECPRGYYCPEESTSRDELLTSYVCPAGLYCDQGMSVVPTGGSNICPQGHYCPAGIDYPQPCPVGTYGGSTGLQNATQCTTCPQGYYCLEGGWNVTGPCSAGFYCPEGSTGPKEEPCPGGRHSTVVGGRMASDCPLCPAGFYCPPGTSEPITCPQGYYCPCGTQDAEPCPIGTYGNATGRSLKEDCVNCPPGLYCDGVGEITPTGPCDPGYYCILGAYTSQPPGLPTGGLCPRGGYCVLGSETPESCLPGTFNNFTGAESLQQCVACTAGFYCSGSNNPEPTGPCKGGYFCNGSASVSTQYEAPAGTYTLEGASQAINCPQGTYNPIPAQSNCTACDAGFYCPDLGMKTKNTCTKGHYCPEGSVLPVACPRGTSSNQENNKQESDCDDCPPGMYCDQKGLTEPAGYCSEGHYCTGGTQFSKPIGADQKGDLCAAGRFCPNGTAGVDSHLCPAGTYSPSQGNTKEADCLDCAPGRYCPIAGIANTDAYKCQAGYYCISKSQTATPTDGVVGGKCPNGTYCPEGSSDPLPCPQGQYQSLIAQASCLECPIGFYCESSTGTINPVICPAGKYCPAGTIVPESCPVGTYGNAEGLRNASDCTLCDAGKYCPTPGQGSYAGSCTAGYYCSIGAKSAIGAVVEELGGVGGQCQAGHYCPEGSSHETQCPQGTYSPSVGNTNITACLPCAPGRYCALSGMSSPSGSCDAGYYCSSGSKTNTPVDDVTGNFCPAGKYCPSGASAATPCPAGEYQPSPQKDACIACPIGHFCNDTITGTINAYKCPAGTYQDQEGQFSCKSCPRGSYSSATGLTNVTSCIPCTGGKICTVSGLSEPDGVCLEGYFCTSGAKSETGETGVLGGLGGICPAGEYCPTGSSSSLKCPPGTYAPSQGNTNVTLCLQCPPGQYCDLNGMSAPAGACAAGYYCTGGATQAQPTAGSTGGPCLAGHYCPEQSVASVPCPQGKFTAVTGQQNCTTCTQGSYCPLGTANPIDCTAGHYCPEGTKIPEPCPVGTFSNRTSLIASTQCSLCSGGKFCSITGLTEPDGDCAQGYYCQSGAANNVGGTGSFGGQGGVCTIGNYCPEGTTTPLKCPSGTYNPQTGIARVEDCAECDLGKYCPSFGMTTSGPDCQAGYYCPRGQKEKNPTDYICPAGFYCLEGSSLPTGCPDGTYQPHINSTSCLECPKGFHCQNNATSPTICPLHYYCPNGTGNPVLCGNGTYGTNTGLSSLDECEDCPAGKYCTLGEVRGDCQAGYFCKLASFTPKPTSDDSRGGPCPLGFYCLKGTNDPILCTNGTFSTADEATRHEATGAHICGPCAAGFYCNSDGTSVSNPCPLGEYCPLGEGRQECPTGTYNDQLKRESEADCIRCPAGYHCPNKATIGYLTSPCPLGQFCVIGTVTPSNCQGGTYRSILGAEKASDCTDCPAGYFCPEGSVTPQECVSNVTSAVYCDARSSTPKTCPAGSYCRQRTQTPITCPVGFYCPVNTFDPVVCPHGYYCPAGSQTPSQCPLGYKIRNATESRNTIADACEICPAGTYGNDPKRESCSPCTIGYYCNAGATHNTEITGLSSNIQICPVGYYCLEGTSSPTPCPVGEFNPSTGQSTCQKCQPGQQNDVPGSSACQICGPNAYSLEGAKTCTCNGTHRTYQPSDGMCVCQPGYIFYNQDLTISNDSDSATDCQAILYDRCNAGSLTSNTARDLVGNCVPSDGSSCTTFCQFHGGKGSITDLGVCECESLVNEDEVCDPNCRSSQYQLRIDPRDDILKLYDPSTKTYVKNYAFGQITSGSLDCVNADECEIEAVQMTERGFLGVYNPPFSYFENLLNHSQLSTIGTTKREILTRSIEARGFGERSILADSNPSYQEQNGILQPVVCLSYGAALMWDVSHSSRSHYPVYMKDSLLNTVSGFDYGPFRKLDGLMRSNLSMTTFTYTFKESGVYVFQDNADTDKVMIVRVMGQTETCPTPVAAFKPITTTNLVSLGIKSNSEILLEPDWYLVLFLLLGFSVFIVLMIIGIHFFRTKTWKAAKSSKPKFRKTLPLNEIESKGIGFAQRQLFASKQGDEEVFEDDGSLVDLEGFSIKMFYDKLREHKDGINNNLNIHRDDYLDKYNKILEETQEIKDLLNKTASNSVFTIDIEQYMDRLKKSDNKISAKNIVDELRQQLQKLHDDKTNKKPFDPKKSHLDAQDVKNVYNMDLQENQNRDEAINSYELLIRKLEDTLDNMDDEEDNTKDLDHFNKMIESTKLVIGKSLEKMNDNIRNKDKIQRKEKGENNFNLQDDMAGALRLFLNQQLKTLFDKYTDFDTMSDDEQEEKKQEEQEEEEELVYEESDTESEAESDDENDDEMTKLEKKQKRERIEAHHRHADLVIELEEEMEEEFKNSSALIRDTIKEHSEQTIHIMKENLKKSVSGNLSNQEKTRLIQSSRRQLEDYSKMMEEEKKKQIQDLADMLKKKKLRRLKLLQDQRKTEKEDMKYEEEQDTQTLQKLLDKINQDSSSYGDGIQAEMAKQKELLRQKIEMRQQKRERLDSRRKLQLKELSDKEDNIARQFKEDEIQKFNSRLIGLKKKEFEKQLKLTKGNRSEKEKMMKQYQQDLERYKKNLDGKKRKQLNDLDDRLRARREQKQQDIEQITNLMEKEDIDEQENDLEQLKKIMNNGDDMSETINADKDKQNELLSKRLAAINKLSKARAKEENDLSKLEKRIDISIENDRKRGMKKIRDQIEKQLQEQTKALKEKLAAKTDGLDEGQRELLMKHHEEEMGLMKEHINHQKQHQIDELEKKLEQKRLDFERQIAKNKNDKLTKALNKQERVLDTVTDYDKIEITSHPDIKLSEKDVQRQKQLEMKNKKELTELQNSLKQQEQKQLDALAKSRAEQQKKMEKVIEQRKQLMKKQMEIATEGRSEEERDRIMNNYKDDVEQFENKYQSEAQKQQDAFAQRLALRKKALKKKQDTQLLEKAREQEEKERKLKRQHFLKQEKKLILELITDEKNQIKETEEAIKQVVLPRHKREMDELIQKQQKKLKMQKDAGESTVELELRQRQSIVELKEDHVNDISELKKHFESYDDLLASRQKQSQEIDEELKKFQDQIAAQKKENMVKIENQKEELKKKMEAEMEEMKKKMEAEKEKMRKMLEDEKNKLSVKKLIQEQEKAVENMLKEQKNIETDERKRLLAQHKGAMEAFESALEQERIRQDNILKAAVEKRQNQDFKKRELEQQKKNDEKLNKKLERAKDEESRQEARRLFKQAKSNASLMSMLDVNDRRKKVTRQPSGALVTTVTTTTDRFATRKIIKQPEQKLTEEHAWLGPILQKLKNIEALLLSEKKPYLDFRDERIVNEGVLEEISETSLSLHQLVYFRFGEFIIRLLRSKFPQAIPHFKLFVAKKLPHTYYEHNAFKNSFFYDKDKGTLHVRDHRFSSIGKLIVLIVHCTAHIALDKTDLSNDEHPDFQHYFLTMMEVICEDMFLMRQPHAGITQPAKEQIQTKIAEMKMLPNSTTPKLIMKRGTQVTSAKGVLKRSGTQSIMGSIASQQQSAIQEKAKQVMAKLKQEALKLRQIGNEHGKDSDVYKKQVVLVKRLKAAQQKLAQQIQRQQGAAKPQQLPQP